MHCRSDVTGIDPEEDIFYKWMFSQPIKRTLTGRNDRGHNVMYLRGRWAGGIRSRRQIFSIFKKGWYAHEQQMD